MRPAFLVLLAAHATCFNLDTKTAIVHKTSSDTWFGYSVQFYNDTAGQVYLLVGAPKDQSPRQNEIRRGGRVYRCNTDKQSCQSISRFEEKGERCRRRH